MGWSWGCGWPGNPSCFQATMEPGMAPMQDAVSSYRCQDFGELAGHRVLKKEEVLGVLRMLLPSPELLRDVGTQKVATMAHRAWELSECYVGMGRVAPPKWGCQPSNGTCHLPNWGCHPSNSSCHPLNRGCHLPDRDCHLLWLQKASALSPSSLVSSNGLSHVPKEPLVLMWPQPCPQGISCPHMASGMSSVAKGTP